MIRTMHDGKRFALNRPKAAIIDASAVAMAIK